MRHGKSLKIIAALLLTLMALGLLLPWKTWLESRLKSELAARGLSELSFSIGTIGLRHVTLENISFGPASLQLLSLSYRPLELLKGNLRTLDADSLTITQDDITIALQGVKAQIAPDTTGENWQGTWEISAMDINGTPIVIPPLKGKGTLAWENPVSLLRGELASSDGAFHAGFALDYSVADKAKGRLSVSNVSIPWNGGVIAIKKADMPLFGDKPVVVPLALERVSLNSLMQTATSHRASATGVVSGIIPVRIGRDGSFTFLNGQLKAEEAGTIILQPDAIPGDNQQVALVRDILQNFHYSSFSMGVDSGKDNKLSMLLSLQGNNPDVYNGRQINLNVHLTGDVISMLQQSVTSLQDPKQLLKQGNYGQ
jgi:hypothetical protein